MNSTSKDLKRLLPIFTLVASIGALAFSGYLYYQTIVNWQDWLNIRYYNSDYSGKMTWLGVTMEQNPCDIQSMQEVLYDIKPDVLIEAGTFRGGSTLCYATVLSQIKPNFKIYTIDTDPHIEKASKFPIWKEHVVSLKGMSTDPSIVDKIKNEIPKGAVVLVTLDSNHSRDNVYKELQIYSQLVTPGSYLVVQDTNVNGHPVYEKFGPGPMEAVNDFLKENHDYVPDRSREKYILTYYPKGWLKRLH